MFERVIASILTRLLGEYVEDSTFSAEKVSLGIWRGNLILEDLHIKKGLLDTLELPLALKHGIIGKLTIQIPWKQLGRDHIVVAIDRVFLVVEPKLEWDADAVKSRERAIKRTKLAAAELFRTSPLEEAPSVLDSGLTKGGWGSGLQKWVTDRLVTRIVDSLQVRVQEVHIRYEDHLSHPTAPFYVGVTMESLHVDSTEREWRARPRPRPGSVAYARGGRPSTIASRGDGEQGDEDTRRAVLRKSLDIDDGVPGRRKGKRDRLVKKVIQLDQLAVYWNPAENGNPCSMHLSDIPVDEAEVVISRLIARNRDIADHPRGVHSSERKATETSAGSVFDDFGRLRHRYILEPANATALLELSLDPADRSQPRLQAHADVSQISARLEDFQLQDSMCLGATMAQYAEVGKYSKYRPEVSVLADPSAWWHYAFAVIVEKLRAERGGRRYPDVVKRRRLRLEYMPLWRTSLGLSKANDTAGIEGITGAETSVDQTTPGIAPMSPRSPTTLPSPGIASHLSRQSDNEDSPWNYYSDSVASSSSYSSDWRSSAGTDDCGDGEVAVWGMGLGGGGRRVRRSGRVEDGSRRRRTAAAKEDPLTIQRRLEELEDQLPVEDIIVFRAMAEREIQRVRQNRNANRWGIGGWVSWALGSGTPALSEAQEEGQEVVEDQFQRLFAAIDFDPSRAPPSPWGGSGVEATGMSDWVAAVVDIRVLQGSLVLAVSDAGSSRSKQSYFVAKKPKAVSFMEVGVEGFCLSAELHGEDMDGVLASVALDDFGVFERNPMGYEYRGHQDLCEDSLGDIAARRSRIITRRRTNTADGIGGISQNSSATARLFEMSFEMNPRDPEYDAKIYLMVDQVEAVVSPAAGWLERGMAFIQAPDEMDNWATLELAATNKLKNLRAQLESKLELVMSDRFQTFLNLHVKAPLIVVPIEVDAARNEGKFIRGHGGDKTKHEKTSKPGDQQEKGEKSEGLLGRSDADEMAGYLEGAEHGKLNRGASAATPRQLSRNFRRELLLVDLGSVHFTTARLAHLRSTDEQRHGQQRIQASEDTSSKDGSRSISGDRPSEHNRGRERKRSLGSEPTRSGSRADSVNSIPASIRWRRARSSSSLGPAGEATGKRWHSNFYDIFNVDVDQIGVMLKRDGGSSIGSDYASSLLIRGMEEEASSVDLWFGEPLPATGASTGYSTAAEAWLVEPFDVKVEVHVSVIPNDPSISQLKLYGDLPELYVRLSQSKLQRLAGMSVALAAQSAALEASQAERLLSRKLLSMGDRERKREPVQSRPGSDAGSLAGGRTSLVSFLEFQQTLSDRFNRRLLTDANDTNHAERDGGASDGASSQDLRRLRLSQDSLGWGGGSNEGRDSAVEEFASAWGGISGRGDNEGSTRSQFAGSLYGSAYGGSSHRGSGAFSTRSSGSLVHSSSGDSEFFDADYDGGGDRRLSSRAASPALTPESSPVGLPDSSAWATASRVLAPAAGGEARGIADATGVAAVDEAGDVGLPQSGRREAGLQQEHPAADMNAGVGMDWTDRVEQSGGTSARDSEDEGSLDFQDARDPVSEMDETLMAKEAEKAELMKQRQRLRAEQAREGLVAEELESLWSEIAQVAESLEVCEEELKELGMALEELTEFFQEAGRQNHIPPQLDESAFLPAHSELDLASKQGVDIYENLGADTRMPPSSPFFQPPPGRRQRDGTGANRLRSERRGRIATPQPASVGPNRELVMCGLTIPLIRVDLLQDKDSDSFQRRRTEREHGTWQEAADHEEEVISLQLIGIGMQLHSKSYSARFSFSLQDLELEDRLQASKQKVAAESPGPDRIALATSTPRLLPRRRRTLSENVRDEPEVLRRGVTFSERGLVEEEKTKDKIGSGLVAETGGMDTHIERTESRGAVNETSAALATPQRARSGIGDDGRHQGIVRKHSWRTSMSRPDFVQLSYATKKLPGVTRRGLGRTQESHRVKLLIEALELSLEQGTILALVNIASSVAPGPPLSTPTNSTPEAKTQERSIGATGDAGDPHGSAEANSSSEEKMESTGSAPSGAPVSRRHLGGAEGHGQDQSAAAIMLPMLPKSVTVTLAVDVSSIGVVLTEGGAGVAALTLSAAQCKVNAEDDRVKAVVGLGDLSVTNMMRNTADVAPSAGDGGVVTRGSEERGTTEHEVIGRNSGARGPLLDIAVEIIASKGSEAVASGVCRGNGGSGRGGSTREDAGVEARAKIRMDKLKTVFFVPFLENLAEHVVAGPLVSYMLQEEEQGASSRQRDQAVAEFWEERSLSPSQPPEASHDSGPPPALDEVPDIDPIRVGSSSDITEAANVPHQSMSSLQEPSEARFVGVKSVKESPPVNGSSDGGLPWKRCVLLKVGLEVCESAVELPFDNNGSDGATLELGHFISTLAWVPQLGAITGSEESTNTERGQVSPGLLRFEAMMVSAAIKVGHFDFLEAVHARVVGLIPFISSAEQAIGFKMMRDSGSSRDDILERVQERCSGDDAGIIEDLPCRPVLVSEGFSVHGNRRRSGDGGPVGGSVINDNCSVPALAQLAVRVTPVRVKLTVPHLLSFVGFAEDTAKRLSKASGMYASLLPPPLPLSPPLTPTLPRGDVNTNSELEVRSSIEPPQTLTVSDTSDSRHANSREVHQAASAIEQDLPREENGVTNAIAHERDGTRRRVLPGALDGEQTGVISDDTFAKAPVLPPFLGTIIVDAASLMLLSRGSQGVESGKRLNLHGNHSSRAVTDAFSSLVFLEVIGVGLAVDLAKQPSIANGEQQRPPSLHEDAEEEKAEGAVAKKHRVEIAIKQIILTDVCCARLPSAPVRLFGGAVGDDGHSVQKRQHRGAIVDEDLRSADLGRILAPEWWRSGGDAHRSSELLGQNDYHEQFLLTAYLCPVSNAACIDAIFSSGHFMSLSAPILDVLHFVSDVQRGIANRGESALESQVAIRSPVTLPSPVSDDVLHHNPRASRNHREVRDNNEQRVGGDWRQCLQTLGLSAVSETFPWLHQASVRFSAKDMQLWLPDTSSSIGKVAQWRGMERPSASRGDGSVALGPEAVVASCSLEMGLTVVISLLSDSEDVADAARGRASDSAVANRTAAMDVVPRDSQGTEGNGSNNNNPANASGAENVQPTIADAGNLLCRTSFNLRNVEVFVARVSMADFGPPAEAAEAISQSGGTPPVDGDTQGSGDDDTVPAHKRVGEPLQHKFSAERVDPAEAVGDGDSKGSVHSAAFGDQRQCSFKSHRIVLPFSADVTHTLSAHRTALSSSSNSTASCPLRSEVDVCVTEMHVCHFLDFTLATKIFASSINPLLLPENLPPEFVGASQGSREDTTGGKDTLGSDHPRVGESERRGSMASEGTDATSSALSQLMRMWACRVRLKPSGLRMTVVNNLYQRQRMPILNVIVSMGMGELTASGASKSLKASVSSRVSSNFYNIRLGVWEPLLEPWEVRLEIQASAPSAQPESITGDNQEGRQTRGLLLQQSSSRGRVGGGRDKMSARMSSRTLTNIRGWGQRQTSARVAEQGRGYEVASDGPAQAVAERDAGAAVRIRLLSDQMLNLNLAESLVENLGAIVLAQQLVEKKGKPSAADAWAGRGVIGDGSSGGLYSPNWVRNETGLLVVCSADGAPIEIEAGDELPLPLPHVSTSNNVDESVETSSMEGGDDAEDTELDDIHDSAAVGLPAHATTPRTSSISPLRRKLTSRHRPIATDDRKRPQPSQRLSWSWPQSARKSISRRKRGPRAVVLEIMHDRTSPGIAGTPTSWRALRAIPADVVGQRLVTLRSSVSSNRLTRQAALGQGRQHASSLSRNQRWEAGKSSAAITPPKDRESVKVVTEVESHHGVKVLRVRSLVEITNGMGRAAMHVGVLRQGLSRLAWTTGSKLRGLGSRVGSSELLYEWETIIEPGQSCPVPVPLASAACEGHVTFAIKPVSHGAALGGPGRGDCAVNGYEEALLTLPQPAEWEAADGASYHRLLEFDPVDKSSHRRRYSLGDSGGGGNSRTEAKASGSPAFCAVRAVLQGAARRGKGGVGGEQLSRRVGRVIVLSLEPTMSVNNLLAAAADVRLEYPASAIPVRRRASTRLSAYGSPRESRSPLTEVASGVAESRKIQRGTRMAWLDCAPQEEVRMAVHLPGFEWSDPITLPTPSYARTRDDGDGQRDEAGKRTEKSSCDESDMKSESRSERRVSRSPPGPSGEQMERRWRKGSASAGGGHAGEGGRRTNSDRSLISQMELTLKSPQGAPLVVNVDVSHSTCGVRTVSMWVPYWVVNTTSLPLAFQHDPFALGIHDKSRLLLRPDGEEVTAAGRVPPAVTNSQSAVVAAPTATTQINDDANIGDSEGQRQQDAGNASDRGGSAAFSEADRRGLFNDGIDPDADMEEVYGENRQGVHGLAKNQDAPGESNRRPSKLFQQPTMLGLKHLLEDEPAVGAGSTSSLRADSKDGGSGGLDGRAGSKEEKNEAVLYTQWEGEEIGDDDDIQRFNPLMMSYTNPERQQGRVRVRVDGSTWSKPFGLDQAGTQKALEVNGTSKTADPPNETGGRKRWMGTRWSRAERQAFALGVSISLAPPPFDRTKVVAFAPRYVLVNATDRGIEIQQAGVAEDIATFKVPSGAQVPFHWPEIGSRGWFIGGGNVAGRRHLIARILTQGGAQQGWEWKWSGEFSPKSVGDVTLRLTGTGTGPEGRLSREVAFMRVGAVTKGSCVHLVFRRELPSFAPYRVDNFSLETLTIRQVGVNVVETLLPYQSCPYNWDEPLGERALIVERLLSGAGSGSVEANGATANRAAAASVGRSGAAVSNSFSSTIAKIIHRSAVKSATSATVGVYGLDLIRPSAVVGNLRIDMEIDGPTRTLRFSDARSPSRSGSSLTRRHSTEVPASDGNSSGAAAVGLTWVQASVRLEGVGISVIDAYPRELLYITTRGVALDYVQKGQEEHARASVAELQIDNQLVVTPYPTLLYPIPEALAPQHRATASNAATAAVSVPVSALLDLPLERVSPPASGGVEGHRDREACFEVILQRNLGYAWAHVIRLASLRMVPMDINLDGALVEALLETSVRAMEYMEVDPAPTLGLSFQPSDVAAVSSTSGRSIDRAIAPPVVHLGVETVSATAAADAGSEPSHKLYLEELAISPIRLHVSYTTKRNGAEGGALHSLEPLDHHDQRTTPAAAAAAGVRAAAKAGGGSGGGAAVRALLRALGTSLSRFENAPVLLNSLALSNTMSTPDELLQTLVVHYRGQAVRQVVGIMASSELLGNPAGLMTNISAGIKDFLYEPVKGLSNSPFGFATGVFKGTSSLVRRTLYSFVDTADRIVSTVSSGILASGAVDVVVRGGTGVVRPYGTLDGAMLGFAGAVQEPLTGFRIDGFHGMARGLFTGWVGLVLRPMYGTLLSTSQVCQALSGYLDPRLDSEQKLHMLRARPPRFFRSRQQVLSVYSREENMGEELLSRVHMGRYRSDGYVWHATVKDMIVLVTGRRLLMLHGPTTPNRGRGRGSESSPIQHTYCVVEWEVEFDLFVWLESQLQDDSEGRAGSGALFPRRENASVEMRGRRSPGVGGRGNMAINRERSDDAGAGTTVSVYHFPDVYSCPLGRGNVDDEAHGEGRALAALRFERRTISCEDRAQALQLCRVLAKQIPTLARASLLLAQVRR